MGAQAFDARQLTSANSSIPLEKRSHLAAIAFLAFVTRASLPGKGSAKDIRRWLDQFWDHLPAVFQAEVEQGKGREMNRTITVAPVRKSIKVAAARSRISCLHRGHVALVTQEPQHQQNRRSRILSSSRRLAGDGSSAERTVANASRARYWPGSRPSACGLPTVE
jgi:hypothetical protein